MSGGPVPGAGSIDPNLRYLLARAADAKAQGMPEAEVNTKIQEVLKGTNYAAAIKDFPTLLTVVQKATGNPVTEPQPTAPATSDLGITGSMVKSLGAGLLSGVLLGHASQVVGGLAGANKLHYSRLEDMTGSRGRDYTEANQAESAAQQVQTQAEQALGAAKQAHPGFYGTGKAVGTTATYGLLADALPLAGAAGAATAGGIVGAAEGQNRTLGERALTGGAGAVSGLIPWAAGRYLEAKFAADLTAREGLTRELVQKALGGKLLSDGSIELPGQTVPANGGPAHKVVVFKDGEVRLRDLKSLAQIERRKVWGLEMSPMQEEFPNAPAAPKMLRLFQQDAFAGDALRTVRHLRPGAKLDLEAKPPTWDEIREVRQVLTDEHTAARREGRNTLGQQYRITKMQIDAYLDGSTNSNFSRYNSHYEATSRRLDAFEQGRADYRPGASIEDLQDAKKAAATVHNPQGNPVVDPEAAANWEIGALADEAFRIGKRGGEVTKGQYESLSGVVGRARVREALFGSGPGAEAKFDAWEKSLDKLGRIRLTQKTLRHLKYYVVRPFLFGAGFEALGHIARQGHGGSDSGPTAGGE